MSVASITVGSSRAPTLRAWTTPVLAVALVAATGWAVLSGGWGEATPTALCIGVAGALQMLVLGRARAAWWQALLVSPLFLFVTLLPATLGTHPALAPPGGVGALVVQYAGAIATGLLGNDSWQFGVSLDALLWGCGAWAAWLALRERRGALASAPAWAILAVTVINAPDSTNLGLPASVAAVVAILLIAAVHLDRLSDSWTVRRVSVLPGTDGRFAAAAAAGGIVVVLLAAVLPPLTSTDVSGHLFGFGAGGGPGSGSGSSVNGVGPDGTVRFNPATIPGGPLSLADIPVLTYTTATGDGSYLRMATDAVFSDGNWLPDESALGNGDFGEVLVSPGVIPRDRVVADGGVGVVRASVAASISLTNDTSGTDVMPFPGEPDTTSLAGRARGLVLPGPSGQLITVDSVSSNRNLAGATFTVTGTQSVASADQLRSAGQVYPSFIERDGFLALPDPDPTGGIAAIHALALQWTAQAANPYDAATAIESHLRDPRLFRYTLSPPLPRAGSNVWPVTYFLTTSHAGYCQYFATAMGAMLRSLGIPARLVNGYGPGSTSGAAVRGVENATTYTVTSNDAHTWVEAYFAGYGWVPFEPTPPSSAGDYAPFTRGTTVPSTAPPSASASAAPSSSAAVSGQAGGHGGSGGAAGVAVAVVVRVVVIAGAVALVIALFATWFLRPRAVRGVWRRLALLGALAGVRRDSSLTFSEYAGRLAAALPRGSPAPRRALAEIAALSSRAVYARDGGAGDAAGAATAWRRLVRSLPRHGWHLLRRRRVTP